MNIDWLLWLLPTGMFLCLYLGLYQLTLAKRMQAKATIQGVFQRTIGPNATTGKAGQKTTEVLFKKRTNASALAWFAQLDLRLERANWLISVPEFLAISVGMALLMGCIGFFTGQHPVLMLVLMVAGFLLPQLVLLLKMWLRLAKAGEQFADVLDAMVNCFKTGYGFNRAIQMVADNYEDPWGIEFGKMASEISLGLNPDEALASLARRMPSPDMDLFVTALLIQKETGGNMAELLATLSKTCRERYKLFRKVGAISAQGKLSASIVCCVPFFLLGIMYLFLPQPVNDFITNPIGIVLMSIAGFWMCCGIGVLFKIVQIEV
jgi:tight adherence protein B